MDFRQAEQFLAVVEHGGIGRAAQALSCAQPSLSRAIRVLERELRAPLFHRVGRGLVPTAAGRALVQPARTLLRDLATAQALVAEVGGIRGGVLDLAGAGGTLQGLLAVVGDFRQLHPAVRLRIQTPSMETELVRDVRQGRAELGFLPLADEDAPEAEERTAPGLELEQLGTETFQLVLPPDADPDLPDPLPIGDLPDLDVVGVPNGARGRAAVEAALRRHGVRTRLSVSTEHRATQRSLVAHGLGMAFVAAAQLDQTHDAPVLVRDLDPPIAVPHGVIYRSGYISPQALSFLDLARRRFRLNK